jgi:hypothetical protein
MATRFSSRNEKAWPNTRIADIQVRVTVWSTSTSPLFRRRSRFETRPCFLLWPYFLFFAAGGVPLLLRKLTLAPRSGQFQLVIAHSRRVRTIFDQQSAVAFSNQRSHVIMQVCVIQENEVCIRAQVLTIIHFIAVKKSRSLQTAIDFNNDLYVMRYGVL